MSTTDGTAVFEKRKFADNSKLSTFGNSKIELSITQPTGVVDTFEYLIYGYTCPCDGSVVVKAAHVKQNKTACVDIRCHDPNSYNQLIYPYGIFDNYCWGISIPFSKGNVISVSTIYIDSVQHVVFVPTLSAT